MKKLNEYRIVFMGTPEIAARVFENLINFGLNFVGLIAQEDKPVGRKGILEPVATKLVAQKYNIPVFQPHRIRKEYEFLYDLKPDLILTMAYGQIVPQAVLDVPPYGCLNLHGSLLPKYRGAAPIQRSLINGDKTTGITLMEMIDKMDAGRMYAKEEVTIDNDNYSSLCLKLIDAATKVVQDNLYDYFNHKLVGIVQDESEVTFADKILPSDEKLDINLGCEQFINFVNGLSFEPGGYVYINDKKLKILKAHKVSSHLGELGQLSIKKEIVLSLVDGDIVLDVVQLEGKKRMDGKSFANGNRLLDQQFVK